jgi:hypothetical protein
MTKLETATHVFLIAVCCLAGGLLIEQRFFSGEDSGLPTAPTVVGREVKLPGADWQSAPVSVLLQISSTCHFCNDSMPFYRKMMAARQASGAKIPVIVASADAVPVMQQHLADRQVSVDKVLHSRLDGLHCRLEGDDPARVYRRARFIRPTGIAVDRRTWQSLAWDML